MFYINNLLYKIMTPQPDPQSIVIQKPQIPVTGTPNPEYISRTPDSDRYKMTYLGQNVMKVVKSASFFDVIYSTWPSWLVYLSLALMIYLAILFDFLGLLLVCIFILVLSFYMTRRYAMYTVRSFFYYDPKYSLPKP